VGGVAGGEMGRVGGEEIVGEVGVEEVIVGVVGEQDVIMGAVGEEKEIMRVVSGEGFLIGVVGEEEGNLEEEERPRAFVEGLVEEQEEDEDEEEQFVEQEHTLDQHHLNRFIENSATKKRKRETPGTL